MKRLTAFFLFTLLLLTCSFASLALGAPTPTPLVVTDTSGISSVGDTIIDSGEFQLPEESSGGGQHLTQEEWEARWDKYTARNGETTGTVYMDENGAVSPAEIKHLGLGRSTILVSDQELLVPTSSLKWDTEAPEDMVLAVSSPEKQSYLTLRATKSKKAFVMGHCDKSMVVRVIKTGPTWTFVDLEGVRAYVLTSGLTFYDNAPKNYAAGIITFRGKTKSKNTIHVRTAPRGKQITDFPTGTPVTVFSEEDGWFEVDVAGMHCYIASEFVTLEEPLITAEARTEPTAEN